jgi:regulator of sigma E protease
MPTLLIFILVFAVLVIAHEWGHFAAARLGHVEVDEFGLGLPPRFWTLWRNKGTITVNDTLLKIPRNFELPFDWYNGIHQNVVATYDHTDEGPVLRTIQLAEKETPKDMVSETVSALSSLRLPPSSKSSEAGREGVGSSELRGVVNDMHPGMAYTLNMLPVGGFVRPRGENDPKVPGGLAAASPWTRLGVLLAGPAMNILLGILIFTIMFMSAGIPDLSVVRVMDVMSDSPAQVAGFEVGDILVSINGQQVDSSEDLKTLVRSHLDTPIEVVVLRNGVRQSLTVTPSSARTADEGAMGVGLENPTRDATFLTALSFGFRITGLYVHEIVTLPARLIRNEVASESARFIGLKGMYDFMNEAIERDTESRTTTTPPPSSGPGVPVAQGPTNYTLALIATLSLSLGIFNLLPIPALDGGRIMFLLPELIFRRRVPPNIENAVHAAGMVGLLILMLVINVMDFVNPVVTSLP